MSYEKELKKLQYELKAQSIKSCAAYKKNRNRIEDLKTNVKANNSQCDKLESESSDLKERINKWSVFYKDMERKVLNLERHCDSKSKTAA